MQRTLTRTCAGRISVLLNTLSFACAQDEAPVCVSVKDGVQEGEAPEDEARICVSGCAAA